MLRTRGRPSGVDRVRPEPAELDAVAQRGERWVAGRAVEPEVRLAGTPRAERRAEQQGPRAGCVEAFLLAIVAVDQDGELAAGLGEPGEQLAVLAAHEA